MCGWSNELKGESLQPKISWQVDSNVRDIKGKSNIQYNIAYKIEHEAYLHDLNMLAFAQ